MISTVRFTILIALAWLGLAPGAQAALKVVTSTPELASIAREVGGSRISVGSLAQPDQDYHKVEARPSYVRRVSQADLLVRIGMDMDLWMDAVINAARNSRVARGGPGYVDASAMIRKLEIPHASITGASGDIHVMGNPHYWLDPGNGKVIAYEILLGLRKVDPKNASTFDKNYRSFIARIDAKIKHWDAQMARFRGHPVVAYHDEWIYFYKRFGLSAFGYLEPKPGIPPSAGHISSLITRMKSAHVKAVIVPSIYPMRFPQTVSKATGAEVVKVPYSVGAMGTKDYIDYIDSIVTAVARGMK